MECSTASCRDHLPGTGYLAAIGAMSALRQRQEQGGFWEVEAMLAGTAMALLTLPHEAEDAIASTTAWLPAFHSRICVIAPFSKHTRKDEHMDEQGLGQSLETLREVVTTWGIKALGALVVLILGLIAAKWIRSSLRSALTKRDIDDTLVPFLASLVYYLVLAFVLIAVLGMFGIEATSMVAVLGAAGLAVGLAMQGTLSNFAAGVMLLVFRPFKVGDFVDAGGVAGSVVEIAIFSTTLHSPDNVRITVPNSSIYGAVIKNFSANDTRRNDMTIGIGYGDDIGKAIEVLQKCLDEDARVLKEPASVIAVSELGDSSVNLVVRPWCTKEDYWGLRFDLTRKMKEEIEDAGCSIPFPQTDVHLHKVS